MKKLLSCLVFLLSLHLPLQAAEDDTAPLAKPKDLKIQICALADSAEDKGGKLSLIGTFDTLSAKKLPVIHPSCAVAVRMEYTAASAGEHHLEIQIVKPGGGQLLDPKLEAPIQLDIAKDQPFVSKNVTVNLKDLRFDEAGVYTLKILLDGKEVASQRLRIVMVKDAK